LLGVLGVVYCALWVIFTPPQSSAINDLEAEAEAARSDTETM